MQHRIKEITLRGDFPCMYHFLFFKCSVINMYYLWSQNKQTTSEHWGIKNFFSLGQMTKI